MRQTLESVDSVSGETLEAMETSPSPLLMAAHIVTKAGAEPCPTGSQTYTFSATSELSLVVLEVTVKEAVVSEWSVIPGVSLLSQQ